MKEPIETYHELIVKYLSKEASVQEEQMLFAWLKEDIANQHFYDQLKMVWGKSGEETTFEPNTDVAWNKLSKQLNHDRIDTATKKEAKLITLFQSTALRIAASIVLVLGFAYLFLKNDPKIDRMVELSAQTERTMYYLPDSSKVWLNANSTMSYTADFEGEKREVYLKGDAFFEVTRNENKPFVVITEQTTTEVLGTSFQVYAVKSDTIEYVLVESGKVKVSRKQNSENSIVLTKGQKAVLPMDTEMIRKEEITQTNTLAWHSKRLSFDNTSLDNVVVDLSNYFDVEITLENEHLKDCYFTGQFDSPQLEEVLEILFITVNSTHKKEKNQIILSGEGCQ